ncbi:galactokinase [Erythrobacter sp. YT30]|uniref:galactokinase n=1 Tax=Erythrobacter sp. YT30 TaxID=1735012 RepID=UPI00076BE6DE|nr:galactokinase [Erythrobacter sp. YT30]KWV91904.1 galactokinase [Erythrobacter sp. YT30]
MTRTFTASAPGRVNLIGEHTDYNGGMVLPAALSVGIEITLAPRSDGVVAVTSNHYHAPAIRDVADDAVDEWADIAVGAVREANSLGFLIGGANIDIVSTMPEGSGLSSSAALIVAILKAARKAAVADTSDVKIAIAARRVENNYIGVPCGIMDQMAVALATPGTAMALDTKSLDWTIMTLPAGFEMVVLHSGLTRKLSDGRYAERKVECDMAKAYFGTEDLCLLDAASVAKSDLDPVVARRVAHLISEHARVQEAVTAMSDADMVRFGALMVESHASMRDQFEMSLPEIDALVESAIEYGALGARLTGGGFGGCIVACVAAETRETWLDKVLKAHPDARYIDEAGEPS